MKLFGRRLCYNTNTAYQKREIKYEKGALFAGYSTAHFLCACAADPCTGGDAGCSDNGRNACNCDFNCDADRNVHAHLVGN
jgi:hypothetical protein